MTSLKNSSNLWLSGGVSAGADPLHTMQLPVGGTWRDFYRWAVDVVVMGCKTRVISSGFQSSWGDWMIRYDKWRFDDRRFGGFIRTREMPQGPYGRQARGV